MEAGNGDADRPQESLKGCRAHHQDKQGWVLPRSHATAVAPSTEAQARSNGSSASAPGAGGAATVTDRATNN
jgi:hypothetical protein